jgi:hypothetical protein
MSDHSEVVVKVLVDAIFYEKCLAAYHESERKKTTQPNQSSGKPELEGAGIIFKDPPENVPKTDSMPTPQNKLESSTVVMDAHSPVIIPADISAPEKPKEHLEKKRRRAEEVFMDDTDTFSFQRPKGVPWYYIGESD